MRTKRNSRRLLAASLTVAGLAAGAMAVHADTFSQRSAQGASQDLSTTPPPAWPSVPPTPGCATECSLTLHVGAGTASITTVSGVDPVPFWGFGVNTGAPALAGAPSSIIKVPQGALLHITVDQATGTGDPIDLTFPSLPASDVVKIDISHYDVTASQVGTSVFQPGVNADAPRQISMGLVGVLIVTPTGCVDTVNNACGYSSTTSYKDEAVVATTTLDPEFAANPLATGANAFDMSYFGKVRDANDQPRKVYHVINGQAFPDTQVIDARNGDSVLLRYVNAGVFDESLGVLGLRESLLGRNTSAYQDPQTVIAPLIGPGETADVGVDIPADAPAGQRYSIMDQGRQMNHGDGAGFGGALTFINVWAGTPVAPTFTGLSYDFATGVLTGTAVPSAPAFPVQSVEWSTDNSTWTPVSATAPVTAFSFTQAIAGDTTFYLRATDSNNLVGTTQVLEQPGPPTLTGLAYDLASGHLTGTAAGATPLITVTKVEYSLDAFNTAAAGAINAPPAITAIDFNVGLTAPATISVKATDSNGKTTSVDVPVNPAAPTATATLDTTTNIGNITGTGTATAGLTIAAAEYFVGADPGTGNGTAMSGTFGTNAVNDLAANPAVTFTSGAVVSVRVKDNFGQWSAAATVNVP